MPINSYVTPHQQQTTSTDRLEPSQQLHPDMQRFNSLPLLSLQLNDRDRRRRGSSFGNLFSSFTSSLRPQPVATNSSTNTTNFTNSTTNTTTSNNIGASPRTSSSSNTGLPSLSHQPSTATIRPSLNDSRQNSGSFLTSPTMADLTGAAAGGATRSSTSLNNNRSSEDMAIDPLQEEELENDSSSGSGIAAAAGAAAGAVASSTEDDIDGARTRQNSTLFHQTLAESTSDKRETDGSFSIRLTPFIDHSSSSPALYFSPLIRRLKPGMRLPIGRYTERNREAAQLPHGSSAAVVFKSKVVSRTHLEILVDEHGNWYIKDLKSSSGTFLNHVRLSPAGQESDDCMVCDGDILQLGMDFRGGSEEIFRCVKVRIELNKSWKRKTHKFNKDAHKKLLGEETECCICLNDLKVGDSIFISPCSHSWHYKCIRPLLVRNYPQFHCPNCRCITDLEEDDDDEE